MATPIEQYKLSNGTRVIIAPSKDTRAVTCLAYFAVGSRYESAELWGGSHFIEHMMFKGTEKRPTTEDISKQLDAVGADYNAFTSKDHTAYYIKIDARHTELSLDLLSDMIYNSKFDAGEFDRERGVIVEELNMYEDNPSMKVEELFEEHMFAGNTLGWKIGGPIENIKAINLQKLIAYKKRFYAPEHLVLVLSGKITPTTRALIKKYFGAEKKHDVKQLTYKPFGWARAHREGAEPVKVMFKQTDQMHMVLGFPAFNYDDPRNAALLLLHVILGGSMSSRLFIGVRERRGLCYVIRSGVTNYADAGAFTITSGLDKARLTEAMSVIYEELQNLLKKGVTDEEVRAAKDHLAGKMVLQFEDSARVADYYGQQKLLMKKIETPEEKFKRIMAQTTADVNAVAREIIKFKHAKMGVIGPYKDAAEFLKAAKLPWLV
ncbi:MAG: pitrilysin family protein [Candidatus Magasanikbacteria bacterium]|nr:pitrilysin family protein [Candidatus Magasanikbacteria bacterium]